MSNLQGLLEVNSENFHANRKFTSDRNPSSLEHRGATIHKECQKFQGLYDEVEHRHPSGVSYQEHVRILLGAAPLLLQAAASLILLGAASLISVTRSSKMLLKAAASLILLSCCIIIFVKLLHLWFQLLEAQNAYADGKKGFPFLHCCLKIRHSEKFAPPLNNKRPRESNSPAATVVVFDVEDGESRKSQTHDSSMPSSKRPMCRKQAKEKLKKGEQMDCNLVKKFLADFSPGSRAYV
jgi:ABC-type nickel/cobalt efflux system permease component RcnA